MRLCPLLLLLTVGVSAGRAELVYFLVAERFPGSHFDSYVLPLSDQADIQHARDLASFQPGVGQSIAMARIAPGADGVNRDYFRPGAPEWSWHVTEFLGFADFSAEIFDGWPGYVEQDVDGWMANTGGVIGFWGYTVVAELTGIPETSSIWFVAAGAIFSVVWSIRRHASNGTSMRRGLPANIQVYAAAVIHGSTMGPPASLHEREIHVSNPNPFSRPTNRLAYSIPQASSPALAVDSTKAYKHERLLRISIESLISSKHPQT